MKHLHKIKLHAVLAGIFCAVVSTAQAASYPERPVKIIVPFSAGGTTDLITRSLAAELSDVLGSDVVVENKTGAAGTLGTADVARSKPDGYTIGMLPVGPLTTQPHLRKLPYSLDSFDYICQIYSSPQVLAVQKESPFESVDDFRGYAKENPGEIKFGTTGPGTIPYLAMLSFSQKEDIKIVDVPFQGEANILTALLGGHITAMVSHAAFVVDHAETVKAIGIMAPKRSTDLPDLKTFKEQGVDLVSTVWGGLAVPKGVPQDALETLEEACKTAVASPRLQERMEKLKTPLAYMDSKEFTAFVDAEYQHNRTALEQADIGQKKE